jgi:tetratricopeptide (TPR) repeat protein
MDVPDSPVDLDLANAIAIIRPILDKMPKDDPSRADLLMKLGNVLGDQYMTTGDINALEEAIQRTRESVDLTPNDDAEYLNRLNNLGSLLGDYSIEAGSVDSLLESINVARQVVKATPHDHPDKAVFLSGLGSSLGDLYSETQNESVLDEAIGIAEEVVHLTPASHPNRAIRLNNHASLLWDRYSVKGLLADLDTAIQLEKQAISLTLNNNQHMAIWLSSLCVHLHSRYKVTSAMSDLEECVDNGRRAVGLTPEDDPFLAKRLNNLATSLGDLFLRKDELDLLEEAIKSATQSVDLNDKQLDKALRLNSLGQLLHTRYSNTKNIVDLEKAIQVTTQALEKTEESNSDRYMYLSNLGALLGDEHSGTGATKDVKAAIRRMREAIASMPQDHADRASIINNLVKILVVGILNGEVATYNIKEMSDLSLIALRQANAATIDRIVAGRNVLWLCPDWREAHEASKLAVSLVPRLIGRSLQNSDKQYVLGQVFGLASDAAAAALRAGQPPLDALKILEWGRGNLGASLEEMRVDVLMLKKDHPKLAERFIRLQHELDAPSTLCLDPPLAHKRSRYDAGKDFDTLVGEIRLVGGFSNFLLPPDEKEMLDAASFGPIVIITVSKLRCDAVIIEKHQIRALPLGSLTENDIKEKVKSGQLGGSCVLEWLWDAVASPVLDALGYTKAASHDAWPHVWWVPTGPLTKFPLHAAGYHARRSGEAVLDRVISSYGSSVKAIVHSRKLHTPPRALGNALLVAMEHTPDRTPLPFSGEEVRVLRSMCESIDLSPVEPERHKAAVLSLLQDSIIFHFAGHGYTHPRDPLKSHLLLEDWKTDKLSVADLLETNLRDNPPFLAYLSACGTGRIEDQKYFDESIHLISACQLAGFRHVIGTLWEVNDKFCVDMARLMYKGMLGGSMSDASVAAALHGATRQLRDIWLDSEVPVMAISPTGSPPTSQDRAGNPTLLRDTEIELEDDADHMTPPHWTAYVHFGP